MPYLQPSGGWIELICGSMFSGKTEELLRRIRRAEIARQQVQVFKPKLDDRYDLTQVCFRSGASLRVPHAARRHAPRQ
jgi:thymidine kinase